MAYIIQRHFQSYPAKITASGRSVEQQAVETVAKMVCALIDPSHTSGPENSVLKKMKTVRNQNQIIGWIPNFESKELCSTV